MSPTRRRIAKLDRELVELIARRVDAATAAIRLRTEFGGSVQDEAQEWVVIDRARTWAEERGISPDVAEAVLAIIMDEGKGRFRAAASARPGSGEESAPASAQPG